MSAIPRLARYEDLLALPENVTGEIIGGQLHAQPRPTARHARLELGLGRSLFGSYDLGDGGPGGWIILSEPELHLGEHVLVPDLAGWRRERLPHVPDGPIDIAPDWVCEILSPATARKDRAIKLPLYGKLGVTHAWLVDPAAKTVETYRHADGHWLLLGSFGENDAMRAEPFDAVAIELGPLWAW
ncbi:MAG: Uma2 family endonuclease [Rudaea sp.]|uniref:Uma2 family endonuclease n=1 Tax=Rudaea sp. TaxID=2136325 RepID=UPI0039E62314